MMCDRHIEADSLGYAVHAAPVRGKEVMMTRNVIVGVVAIVVLIAAYFLWRGNETGPQSIPTGTTEPKK